ncbi:mas-related G-protein coupled receptor member H-like [Elgaria multicarinata webbii]|uniref:mas-related G-protein coupled receptor member H-like n=1 Tax=Elgaria multicarinata webbii TaxID=159646 RepID=UPI002FCCF740
MTNLSVTSQSSQDAIQDFLKLYNRTEFPNTYFRPEGIIVGTFVLFTSFFGLLGNGTVIWLLGFQMKRNSFTTYVLNLAVADFGVLIAIPLKAIGEALKSQPHKKYVGLQLALFSSSLIFFMHTTSKLLLTTISIDRCVAVFFPIWHRCHRPKKIPTILCTLTWVLALIFYGIHLLVLFFCHGLLFQVIVNVLICYPLMATSTVTLLVKACSKGHKLRRTKRLMVILLTLLFCLILDIPTNLYAVFSYSYFSNCFFLNKLSNSDFGYLELVHMELNILKSQSHLLMTSETISFVSVCLNSSINPMLYLIAGRGRKVQSRVSMRVRLQSVFTDEESLRNEGDHPV